MDIMARNQYLKKIQEEYLTASKMGKSQLLNESQKRTGLCRKHLITKLSQGNCLSIPTPRKKRSQYYDGHFKAVLVKVWKIFDYPCGQRLAPLLKTEVDRLRLFNELSCSDIITDKLKSISPASIDLKLRHEKRVLNLSRNRNPSNNPLLYQKIPIKVNSDWDKSVPGNCQLDFVAHCGRSLAGEFINSLSLVDIFSGWWEGFAIMHKSQIKTHNALKELAARLPFPLKEIHPDNDFMFINNLIYPWALKNKVAFSRSRPYKKNDNAYIEQKNWTHIRKVFGYFRYDSIEEQKIMNNLLSNQLRLYKNFFQPITKLIKKDRIGSKVYRRYDNPKTPYQRLLESNVISDTKKKHLSLIYNSLNPAKLHREINIELTNLLRFYNNKHPKNIMKIRRISPSSSVRKFFKHQDIKTLISVR
ncbi:MAG: transposase family protein [Candidatus Omnitrophica bacterium]|nr:transposase family protein [Candidatus Omnitrophota bacterium]